MEPAIIEEKIGWRTVKNTVEERLCNLSLIHNLVPYRKLRRTTKALNVALRRYSGIRSYSRYVKMKTSVLRNVSDDNDTDDNDTLSEEDYFALHKLPLPEKESGGEQVQEEIDSVSNQEWNTARSCATNRGTAKKKVTRKKSVPKKSRIINLGWQSVIKKSAENTNYTLNNNESGNVADVAEKRRSKAVASIRPRKFSVETTTTSCNQKLTKNSQKSLSLSQNLYIHHEKRDDEVPLPTELPMSNERSVEKNQKNMKESKTKIPSDKKQLKNASRNEDIKVEGVKKNLAKIFAQHSENEHETHNSLNKNKNELNEFLTEKESSSVSPAKASSIDSNPSPEKSKFVNEGTAQAVNQPKDSGIDEDSQEELSEDGKHSESKVGEEMPENEDDRAAKSSMNESNDRDEKEVQQNSRSESEPAVPSILAQKQDTAETTDQMGNNIEEKMEDASALNLSAISILDKEKEETQNSKQHPKVMCTEIVNQKITIVSKEYQGNGKPVQNKEQSESDLDESYDESAHKAIDDHGSVSANDTIDRCFTLRLDSSDAQYENEESLNEMKEITAESTIIDKNHVLANSTEIQKCEESDSEDEPEKSQDTFYINQTNTRHNYKHEKERNDSLKKMKGAKNAFMTLDNTETREYDSKESAHANSENETIEKEESDSVKDITEAEGSVNYNDRSYTAPKLMDTRDEENSDSSNRSKFRIASIPANVVQEEIELDDSLLIEENEENTEDSMSAFSKKRLQQLKRLNLIVGSESSSDEDADGDATQRNRWRKFQTERKDLTTSPQRNEEEMAEPEKRRALACQASANPYLSDSNEHNESDERVSSTANSHEEKQMGSHRPNDGPTNTDNENKQTPKKRKRNFTEASEQEKRVLVHEKNSEIGEISFPVALHASTPNTASRTVKPRRPKNLQDLVDELNLAEEINDAAFSYKDLGEDDVYLLDVPKNVFETDLLGKKIVLKEKKLKLGTQKYKASYKDVDTVSCFIATGKSRKPFKIVNVKPVAAVVAQLKSPKSALINNINQETEFSESDVNPRSVKKVPDKRKRRRAESNIPEEGVVKEEIKRFKFRTNIDDNST